MTGSGTADEHTGYAARDRLRRATPQDATALRDVERAASLQALGHVFPPEEHPYPDEGVLARWVATLDDPDVTVVVTEDDAGVSSFIAWDRTVVRHLGVRPDAWRRGLATRVLEHALATPDGSPSRLWCLAENHQALAFYAARGWVRTGRSRRAEFPPFPEEVELTVRPGGAPGREQAGPAAADGAGGTPR